MPTVHILGLRIPTQALWEPLTTGICACQYPYKENNFCAQCEAPISLYKSRLTGKETVYTHDIYPELQALNEKGMSTYQHSGNTYIYLLHGLCFYTTPNNEPPSILSALWPFTIDTPTDSTVDDDLKTIRVLTESLPEELVKQGTFARWKLCVDTEFPNKEKWCDIM